MATNPVTDALGQKLRAQFEQVKSERVEVERRWVSDLRQYKGVYEPDEEALIGKTRSKSFTRITRTKVKSATARLMDMVFPAGSENSWEMTSTPVPEMPLDESVRLELTHQFGRLPTNAEVKMATDVQAQWKAKNMEKTVKDQLVEVQYRSLLRSVIQSGNLFGTGILKGPLVHRAYRKQWSLGSTGEWQLQTIPKLMPFIEFTPVWEMYPDTMAVDFSEARFNYQRSIMPKHQLYDLASRKDFKGDVIKEYIREHRDGDTTQLPWEVDLRLLGWNLTGNTTKSKRYEVLEYWGVLEAQELIDMGLALPDDSLEEYWANVWLLGSKVIKVEVQPIEGVELPYYAYYWDKDETSIFGEGIPAVMRDDQKGLNSSVRAVQDNAAITAGPQIEVNIDLLHPDEDVRDVYPFKVWQRSGIGVEAQYPAIRAISMESHTQEYLQLANFFMNNIHEATFPSFVHGEATSKGSVGRTATGLSMLMSAAQISFKDQLFSLDEVQRKFLEGMYHWNMQFSPDPDIKGDFSVLVKGTSSLVAREIRAQNLDQFANSTLNQFDLPFVDRHELNKQRAVVLELGDTIIRDKDQAMTLLIQQLLQQGGVDGQSIGTQTASPPSPATSQGDAGFSGRTSVFDTNSPPPGGAEGGAGGVPELGGVPAFAGGDQTFNRAQ